MASRRVPASIFECTSPMVSALGIGWSSQRFQNRDAPDISSALRLLIRAQNRIMEALATVAVEMRGSGLRSVMEPISRAERWNTLSAYAIRRRSKSGLLLLEAFPFQFGNFIDEALHFLVVGNGLTDSLAPRFGYANLAQLPSVTLHQVHRLVQLAVRAMAVGLTALAGTLREGAAKQPLPGSQLGDTGTEVALSSRELGAVEGLGHILYTNIIQDRDEKQEKNHNTNLLPTRNEPKSTYGIRCFDWTKNLVAESLLRSFARVPLRSFARVPLWSGSTTEATPLEPPDGRFFQSPARLANGEIPAG